MDKKRLNDEIVLCRAAVRKAKVAVIRKLVKKMKILKTCKVEAVKEKKLRKCERLFEKVQIMKRVNIDEVTKFALRNNDLGLFLKSPKFNLKQNALASLAQHDAVVKKINSIREQIPNWETELPLLLDSLGKKKSKKCNSKKESIKTTHNSGESDGKVMKKSELNRTKENIKNLKVPLTEEIKTSKPGKGVQVKCESNKDNSEESDSSVAENLSNSSEKVDKIEKIVDEFFIGKKVIAPKLALESSSGGTNEDKISKLKAKPLLKRETFGLALHTKPSKLKKDPNKFKAQLPKCTQEEGNLHPSWAAKKVKLIKPFEGKKIKFTDD